MARFHEKVQIWRVLSLTQKTNPMKKTVLALVLAAGLTSFAGTARAQSGTDWTLSPNPNNGGASTLVQWNFTGDFLTTGFQVTTTNTVAQFSSIAFGGLKLGSDATIYNTLSPYIPTVINGGTLPTSYALTPGGSINDITTGGSLPITYITPMLQTNGGRYTLGFTLGNNLSQYTTVFLSTPQLGDFITITQSPDQSFDLNVPFAVFSGVSNTGIKTNTSGFLSGTTFSFTIAGNSVPEPSTYALFGLGALALIVACRRKVA